MHVHLFLIIPLPVKAQRLGKGLFLDDTVNILSDCINILKLLADSLN